MFFRDQFSATNDQEIKFSIFATSPAIPRKSSNLFSEIIASFMLVFSIVSLSKTNIGSSVNIFVFGLLMAIAMSLGGTTGFAINPARDLSPRIAHAILPIKDKGSSHWEYAWIPIAGPIIGSIIAAGVYIVLPW